MVNGFLAYASYADTMISFENGKWVARNRKHPSFMALTETPGKNLALGKYEWKVSNDSMVNFPFHRHNIFFQNCVLHRCVVLEVHIPLS